MMTLLSPPRPPRVSTPPAKPTARPAPPRPDPCGAARVLIVLLDARAVVERGWLQREWCRTAPRSWRERLFDPAPGADGTEAACLVAAVVAAAHPGGRLVHPDRDAGPALDRIWQAWRERCDAPGVLPPALRRDRMRDLVAWNDASGRTRDDVLALLDRTIGRERERVATGR